MEFSERLSALRAERGLSQSELAERAGVHLSQLGRYENGLSSPTLEVLRRLCVGLGISADRLLFDEGERDGSRLEFIADAADVLDEDEQAIVAGVIDALVYKHQTEARRRSRGKPGRKPLPKKTGAKRTPRKRG
ncbi:MAG: RstR family transcriptional repressor [Acidimicrobiales bacterium]